MNAWGVFDAVFFGPSQPVSIESTLPIGSVVQHLSALNEPDTPSDPSMPRLSVDVDGDAVYAAYTVRMPERQVPLPEAFRPVFRGRLSSDDGSVRLIGGFGLDDRVRGLGLTAVVVAVITSIGTLARAIAPLANFAWMFPLLFIVATLVARANGGDDMQLIVNNLTSALHGDESPS